MTGRVTIPQIAKALGISREAVGRRAAKGNWPYKEVKVRGGRQRVYNPSHLSDEVRIAVLFAAAGDAQGEIEAMARRHLADLEGARTRLGEIERRIRDELRRIAAKERAIRRRLDRGRQ